MKIQETTLERIATLKQKEANDAQGINKVKTKEQRKPGSPKRVSGNPAAKVEISNKAKEFGKIHSELHKEVDNSAKIAKLKKLIAENKYEVPADKVADKMLEEHLKNEVIS